MSTELMAKELGLGPVCDRCEMLLEFHRDTATWQACDRSLAVSDMWRVFGRSVLGERRYERARRLMRGAA